MAVTILVIGLLVFVGHFLAGLFERTKVPDVLILMLAGILLGPVFHVVTPEDFGRVGPVFTTLALIIILFEGGIHLDVQALRAAAGETLTISLASMAITVLLISHLADLLLPVDFTTALFIGAVLGGTSAAVVVPLMRVLRPNPGPSTVLFLESAAADILVVVLALALLQFMMAEPGAAASAGGGGGGGGMVIQIGLSFLVAGLIGLAGALLWSAVLDRIRRFPNTVFTTLAYVFILYGLTELWGYSGPIAALTFGFAVANLPHVAAGALARVFTFRLSAFADHERAIFGEAVFLVKTFFFVYLGLSIAFADWRAVAIGVVLGVAAFPARLPVVRLLANPATTTRRDAALMSILVPKGLSAAVMASLPAQAGVPGSEIVQGAVYAAVFFSIVTCAGLVVAVERGLTAALLPAWFAKFPVEIAQPAAEGTLPEEAPPPPAPVTDLLEPNPLREG